MTTVTSSVATGEGPTARNHCSPGIAAQSQVRYAEDRVLENAGAIGHSKQVV
jgi:hypothetical protein